MSDRVCPMCQVGRRCDENCTDEDYKACKKGENIASQLDEMSDSVTETFLEDYEFIQKAIAEEGKC